MIMATMLPIRCYYRRITSWRCPCASVSSSSSFTKWNRSCLRPSSSTNFNNNVGAGDKTATTNTLSRILTDEQRSLFNKVNELSSTSRSLARKVGNVDVKEESLLADIARLQRHRYETKSSSSSSMQPQSLFTVVFAGEFNSGKSTLINALLGEELLEAEVLPTTDAITILMANDDEEELSNDNDKGTSSVLESSSIGLDNVAARTQLHLLPTKRYPILSELCFIDTPGTNAILSLEHTSSTLRILHDADLIVFVTSADR